MPEGCARNIADAEESATVYLPEVAHAACTKFKCFVGVTPGESKPVTMNGRSSLTVAGWAEAHPLDWDVINSER